MECPLCKGTGEVRQTAEARPATHIAKVLRHAREEAGFTLRDVEVATGLSNAAISQIETAKIKKPSFHSLVNLCGIYGIPITSLINSIEGNQS
jgi:transcriptional regulator with XRE-family HTH domain